MSRFLAFHRQLGRLMLWLLLALSLFAGLARVDYAEDATEQSWVMVTMLAVMLITTFLLFFNYRRNISQRRRHRAGGQHIELKPLQSAMNAASIYFLPDNVWVKMTIDKTILRTSLEAGSPHTHVCGGNARCSTCRIVILDGVEHCLPRNANERMLADRLSFPPTVRLACQTRITGDVKVRRLVLDDHDIQITSQINPGAVPGNIGEEKYLGLLFADIRGFTSFAEALPPYDVIHALNRYYQGMDTALKKFGGIIDNYMGDGLLALFDGAEPHEVALRSVKAGLGLLTGLEKLRPYFEATYSKMLDIGIGLHYGQVVLGNLGSLRHKRVTVIGDAVNFASRIESANKEAGTRFLISDDTYELVKKDIQIGRAIQVSVKGKTGEHTLYEVTGLASEIYSASANADRKSS
jgi:adenylate cyclase